jgi:hypothetical protein
MTKRALATILSAFLIVGMLPQASAATGKAGASCSKLKATSVVKGKKFTCIKSGKKLVWDKGVLIKPVKGKPTPSPKSNDDDISIKCPKPAVEDKSGVSQVRADSLIGMNEVSAEQCANLLDWGFRVGQRDKDFYPMTKDYRLDRVTVMIVSSLVTRVDVG